MEHKKKLKGFFTEKTAERDDLSWGELGKDESYEQTLIMMPDVLYFFL